MKNRFTFTQQEVLADLVISAFRQERTTAFTYAVTPVPFKDAPEDVLLVVVSDRLTNTGSWLYSGDALYGSVLTRLSDRTASRVNFGSQYYLESSKKMYYYETYITIDSSDVSSNKIEKYEQGLGTYLKDKAEGLVIPLTDLLFKGEPVFKDYEFSIPNQLITEMQCQKAKLVNEVPENEILVVVSDSDGRAYSRQYMATAKREDAIRWTLGTDGLYYYLKDIQKIEIFKGLKPLNENTDYDESKTSDIGAPF